MTTTATTQRQVMASGKRGNPTTHLEQVKITPVQLPSADGQHNIRKAIGMDTVAVVYECYTETHEHTDNSVTVNQVPDIQEGDRLIVGSDTYLVRFAEPQPATLSTKSSLRIILVKDK
jgi:hypothetical protein